MNAAPTGLAVALRRRLLPLALLVLVACALGPPLSFFVLGLKNSRRQAQQLAETLAEKLSREAGRSPRLWKYNTPKLMEYMVAYRIPAELRRLMVLDESGRAVEIGLEQAPSSWTDLWAGAAVAVPGMKPGSIWVAISSAAVYRNAVFVALWSVLMGLTLSGLMFFLPLKNLARAEARIGELLAALDISHRQLQELNAGLAEKVEQRSRALRLAFEQLQQKERQLQQLAGRTIEIQESERRSIARDLHDAVGQSLTALRLQLQLLAQSGTPDASLLKQSMCLVDQTLDEVRRAVARLGPALLDELGLNAALRRYAEDFAERLGVELEIGLDDWPARLPPYLENTCYRLAQEGLTNIARHARASRVRLQVRRRDEGLWLLVEDDGQGFDPKSAATGQGLNGMRERVLLLQGRLEITTSPGEGTRLEALLPLPQAAATQETDAGAGR